jgi:hypothetical protein
MALDLSNFFNACLKTVRSSGEWHHVLWQIVVGVSEETFAATTSSLKTEAAVSSETPVIIYQTTRRHIPQENSF